MAVYYPLSWNLNGPLLSQFWMDKLPSNWRKLFILTEIPADYTLWSEINYPRETCIPG